MAELVGSAFPSSPNIARNAPETGVFLSRRSQKKGMHIAERLDDSRGFGC